MAVASSPTITPPATCASCVFGAARTSLLSFHMQQIETVTLELIPHITVFPDGHRETSYSTQTVSGTEYIHTGRTGIKTYTDPKDITWMYYDATLTYPTTYVHYIDFSGGVAVTTGSETCAAAADATAVSIPEGLSAAPFIRPLGPDSEQVPLELLLYLQDVPAVSAQFEGDALTGCAALMPGGMPYTSVPISTTPPATSSSMSSTLTSSVSEAVSSSVDSTSTGSSETSSLSLSTTTSSSSSSTLSSTTTVPTSVQSSTTLISNSTISSSTSSQPSSSVPAYSSYSAPASSSRVAPEISSSSAAPQSPPAHSTPNPQGPPTSATTRSRPSPEPLSETTQRPHTFLSSPSPEPPSTPHTEPPRTGSPEPTTQATIVSQGNNDHSTAWVISTITGPAVVTTLHPRGGGADSTRTPDNEIPPVTQPHINTIPAHPPQGTPKPGKPQQGGNTPAISPGGGSHQTVQGGSPPGTHTNGNAGGNGGGVTTQHNQQPQQQPQQSPKTIYNLPGTTLTANSNGGVDFDGHTVLPGQTVTVVPGTGASNGGKGGNGGAAPKTIVALPGTGSSGPKVVVDGTTYAAHTTTPAPGSSPGIHDNTGNGGNDGAESYEATLTANGHVLTILQHGASMTIEDTAAHKTTVCDTTALPITFEGQTLSLSAENHAATATRTGDAPTGTTTDEGGVVYVNGIPAATLTPAHDSPEGGSKTTMTLAVFTAADGEVVTALRRPGGYVVLEDKSSTVTVKDSAMTSFAGERVVVAGDGSSVVIGEGKDGKGDGMKVWTERLSTVTSSLHGPATSAGTGDVVKSGSGTSGRGRGGSGGGRRGGVVGGSHGDSGAGGSMSGLLSKTGVLGLVVLGLVGGVLVGL